MPDINFADIKKQISKSDFAKMYFIYGEEKYLVSYYAGKLIAKAGGDKFRDFNMQTFDGGETGADKIAEAVFSLPFMAGQKCVAVSDVDMEKAGAAETAKWDELMSRLPDSTVFVVYLPTIDINLKKSRSWKKFIAEAKKAGNILYCGKATDAQLQKTLVSWAEKRGCTLTKQDASAVINLCGRDMRTLKNELEKLCAFTGTGCITKKEISQVTCVNLEARVFDLSKAILAKEYDSAYKILDMLFYQNEEPVSVLAVLSSAYIDMYRVKVLLQSGLKASDAAGHFDYARKEFRITSAERNARRFSLNMLRQSLNALSEADMALKGSQGGRRGIMDELIAKLLLIAADGDSDG
jgi:DNA polymerase-3 subunit delta